MRAIEGYKNSNKNTKNLIIFSLALFLLITLWGLGQELNNIALDIKTQTQLNQATHDKLLELMEGGSR